MVIDSPSSLTEQNEAVGNLEGAPLGYSYQCVSYDHWWGDFGCSSSAIQLSWNSYFFLANSVISLFFSIIC
ncbi:MAG: hypothetical protein Kow0080_12280 [Candidatus Promineifilaceae bacterium]